VTERKQQEGAQRPYELVPWGNGKLAAVTANPLASYRDKRLKRRIRTSLGGTGISYDSQWRQARIKGVKVTIFAVFSIVRKAVDTKRARTVLTAVLDALLLKEHGTPVSALSGARA
jgi:hypothetical protein